MLITNTAPPLCIYWAHVCLQGRLHGPHTHLGHHIEISLLGESFKQLHVWLASTAPSRPGQEVLCAPLRSFHSRIHTDTRCHLKPNSENRYDKLRLVLSLNCFSLEIDTGARAIHHSLREVGAPRENGSASVRSRKTKKEKKRRK